jgi:hypothetical protein
MKKEVIAPLVLVVFFGYCSEALLEADELTIYQIQYTTNPSGASPQAGNIVNCKGGIVILKTFPPMTPRLMLFDPNYSDGWGGIMVRDVDFTGDFDDLSVGDWVFFTNVLVEEWVGTTCLRYNTANNSGFGVVSENNPIPRPLVILVNDIPAPIEGINSWRVVNHSAEKYEGMLVKVVNVNVQDTGYGKAYDNYILESNLDPNHTCWGSDYINVNKSGLYHPYVQIGQNFCGVAGIIEQYTGLKNGIDYDYYQLVTTSTDSFIINQVADFNWDCIVDFADYSKFADHWLEQGCVEPDWCAGADLIHDANQIVDIFDLKELSQRWLEGRY